MSTPNTSALGEPVGEHRTTLTVAPDELAEHARSLLDNGYRVALVAGHDDGDRLRAVYLFTAAQPDRRVDVHVPLDRAAPRVPSLAGLSFAAGRFEREMRDLFGIVPADHPLPQRLVRHFHWPRGWHPMLADAGEPPQFGDVDGPYPFRTVEGPGVYEIPVGPVHAGMIGPGHFRFSVVGETILNLKARLWFVHRGIEKLFQGRRPRQAIELAERVSGDTTVGHALAFCQAIEDAWQYPVPAHTQRIRAILLELERLYNHITDIGALCNDVGHGILNTHAQRVREQLLRINDEVTGHRLLRGAIHPGGATVTALPDPVRLAVIGEDIAEIAALALGNTVVADRFAGTAVLTREQATDLGTLGYVARASGLTTDARHDHPFLHEVFRRTEHTHTDGDVLSRFLVRAEEITYSIGLITSLVHTVRQQPATTPITPVEPRSGRSGVGIVEGWRGTIVHRVELACDGTLARVKIVDPSFFNWPALPVALADTIVPDFPLTNKSFNLSYAGNDL
ncbi:Ni,Fe-hydrogenase III large subunit/Ni,Fe-hydrogenase III component G [Kibdelosporangium banguiense]|uniref:Ni,Fe-hydrogenase III large subunit/Ni,Fe-hydrogenase III component G n=1 Tax=Kibdelosporangium banguiense TaxID=1365924 RepID=A0ABS4TWL6_9PSEU|nr:NADH-quinone oxidoreductase subunit C [Kibdelosporangium banguiense]MBP2328803.1 Ni,Fe-hydrogenase III large subunit/Ni,Fe-hydrogenase III component G [Kibdelosporangium banguiense]